MSTQFFKETGKQTAKLQRQINALCKRRRELYDALSRFPDPDFLKREIRKIDEQIALLQEEQNRITPAHF